MMSIKMDNILLSSNITNTRSKPEQNGQIKSLSFTSIEEDCHFCDNEGSINNEEEEEVDNIRLSSSNSSKPHHLHPVTLSSAIPSLFSFSLSFTSLSSASTLKSSRRTCLQSLRTCSSSSSSNRPFNKMATLINIIIVSLLLISYSIPMIDSIESLTTLQSMDVADRKECENWNSLCNRIGDTIPYKKCINDTIYVYKTFQNRWTWNRFYCQSAFNGDRNSDLLYLNEPSDIVNFKQFVATLPNIHDKPEISSSALCCLRKVEQNKNVNECFWPKNNQQLISISNDPDNLKKILEQQSKEVECTYLTIQLSSKPEEIKFLHNIPVGSVEDFPFICSYKMHPSCRDYLPTSPTPTIPTTTRPTNPPIRTTTEPFNSSLPTTESPFVKKCTADKDAFGLEWESVLPGQVSRADCPPGFRGTAEWQCDNSGHFAGRPNITCVQKWIDKLSDDIKHNTNNVSDLIQHADLFNQNLHNNSLKLKFHMEIDKMIKIFHALQYHSDILMNNFTSDEVVTVTSLVVKGCSKIVSNRNAWTNDASEESRMVMAESVLRYVQYTGFTFGCVEAKNQSNSDDIIKIGSDSNIYLDAFNMDREQPIGFNFDGMNFALTDHLPTEDNRPDRCPHNIGVGAFFRDLSRYLSAPGIIIENSTEFNINSEIVAFNYNNRTVNTQFPLPNGTFAKMTLRHQNALEFGSKPRCVYWKFSSNPNSKFEDVYEVAYEDVNEDVNEEEGDGSWSDEGCWLDHSSSDRHQSTCVCSHLTNFAVLMDVSGREEPSTVKSVLTIIATSLSVICLVLTITLFALCRELQNRRSTIIINLSACLIVVDLLVLFGLDQTQYEILCKAISVVLLYSLLASFSWMLMEGYHLYQMIILVFSNIGHLKMLYLYLIGYGGPLIVTIAAVIPIALNNGLNSQYFCWISSSTKPYQIWAVTGPATLIIVINTVIMYYVMRTAFQMKFNKKGKFPSSSPFTTSSGSNTGSTNVSNDSKKKLMKKNDKTESNDSSTPTTGRPLPSATVYYRTNQNIVSSTGGNNNGPKSFNTPINGYNGTGGTGGGTDGVNGGGKIVVGADASGSNYSQNDSKNANQNKGPDSEKFSQWISYLKGYVSLMILMGITWLTYVLYIHEFGHFFSYFFIVLNGLQGVFIFITQFLFNKKATTAVKRRFNQMFGEDHSMFSNLSSTGQTRSNTNTNSSSFANNNSQSKDDFVGSGSTKNDNKLSSVNLYQNLTSNTRTTTVATTTNRSTSVEYF